MSTSSNVVPFSQSGADAWIEEYHKAVLMPKDAATIDAYLRILRQFTRWIAIQTTVRYTQVSRAQVKEQLKFMRG